MNHKKIYIASDFHLGVPSFEKSLEREKTIVSWLNKIEETAECIYLVGDIFDFWFEYKHTAPKGFVRFLGKIAELADKGIAIKFFTGNHDMWMFDYLEKELGIEIIREPITFESGNKKIMLGHGDGLGPGDNTYKFLKLFFASRICQWLFARIHPNLGMGIANLWSKKSRLANIDKGEEFKSWDKEWLYLFCKETLKKEHYDYFIFGHRHLVIEHQIEDSKSIYINTGEWVTGNPHYVEIDHGNIRLLKVNELIQQ